MREVSFDVTDEEQALIGQIVERAVQEGYCQGKRAPRHWYSRLTMTMDLTATNANGCPMDFERLLAADGLNFIHDIGGIARHMDRDTGKLGGHFRPRFAKREPAVA